jgi:hypothetical protein
VSCSQSASRVFERVCDAKVQQPRPFHSRLAADLLADANAYFVSAIAHTPAAFTGPGDVPPQNIRTIVNSRGAKTMYLILMNISAGLTPG